MEWLSQNWIWLALFAGVIWLFSRGRHGGAMGGCGMRGMTHEGPVGEDKVRGGDPSRPQATDASAGKAAEQPQASHRHGRGGCC